MYRVKHFSTRTGGALQYDISTWLESREHIQVVSMNVWSDSRNHFATIVYSETQYIG